MGSAKKRIAGAFFAITLCFIGFNYNTASAAGTQPKNYINIVYDDSGSMYENDGVCTDKWCNANYAMSVFAGMLNTGDTLNIYPMGLNGSKGGTINGSEDPKKRTEAISAIPVKGSNTYFSAVKAAYKDLKSIGSSYNKWLVILTDGYFSDEKGSSVKSYLKSYASDGIKVIYLAIGGDAARIDADPDKGLFTYSAENSDEILPKVTAVANQIFQNYQLDDSYITKGGGSITLNFEVPMEQVTIFAQGEAISIGSLKSGSNTVDCIESVSVQASGAKIPNKYGGDARERLQSILSSSGKLCGCIASFSTGNDLLPAGTYTVNVSDTSNVEIYARPVVNIGAEFFSGGERVPDNAQLSEGEYRYKIVFLDPITGKTVESGLLSNTYNTIKTNITNNGSVSSGGAEGTVYVTEGKLNISATAVLPSGKVITTENNLSFNITPRMPPAVDVILYSSDGSQVLPGDVIIAGECSYKLNLTDPLTGGTASPGLLQDTAVEVSMLNNGVPSGSSTAEGAVILEAGDFFISAKASIPNGQVAKSPVYRYDVVNRLEPIKLVITGNDDMDLTTLEDHGNDLLVTCTYGGKPLTELQWGIAEITAEGSNNVRWKVERGDEVSTWVLSPRYAGGNKLATNTGETEVTVSASLTQDRQTVTDTEYKTVYISDMPFGQRLAEWLEINYWWMLALVLISVLLWAYLPKKRFRKMSFESISRMQRGIVPQQKLDFRLVKGTMFTPFTPERGSFCGEVMVNGMPHSFNIDVEADSDQMKIVTAPIFDNGDRLKVGTTQFKYRKSGNEQVMAPDLSEDPVFFGYEEDISLVMPRGSVNWRNNID